MTAPASWYPDPAGRHQYRYWDGTAWTAHASDNGVVATDRSTRHSATATGTGATATAAHAIDARRRRGR